MSSFLLGFLLEYQYLEKPSRGLKFLVVVQYSKAVKPKEKFLLLTILSIHVILGSFS